LCGIGSQIAKNTQLALGVFQTKIHYLVLATTYFPHCGVSSALLGLTSLFGMGRGVTLEMNHQDQIMDILGACPA
jgi:hypothetical protein